MQYKLSFLSLVLISALNSSLAARAPYFSPPLAVMLHTTQSTLQLSALVTATATTPQPAESKVKPQHSSFTKNAFILTGGILVAVLVVNFIKPQSPVTIADPVQAEVLDPAKAEVLDPVQAEVLDPAKAAKPVEAEILDPAKAAKPVEAEILDPAKAIDQFKKNDLVLYNFALMTRNALEHPEAFMDVAEIKAGLTFVAEFNSLLVTMPATVKVQEYIENIQVFLNDQRRPASAVIDQALYDLMTALKTVFTTLNQNDELTVASFQKMCAGLANNEKKLARMAILFKQALITTVQMSAKAEFLLGSGISPSKLIGDISLELFINTFVADIVSSTYPQAILKQALLALIDNKTASAYIAKAYREQIAMTLSNNDGFQLLIGLLRNAMYE